MPSELSGGFRGHDDGYEHLISIYWKSFMKRLLLSFACLLVVSGSTAGAQVIATVDINKILNETSEAKVLRSTLDKKSKAAKAKIEARSGQLKKMQASLKENSSQDKVDKYRAEAKELSRMVSDEQEALKREYARINEKLTTRALAEVKAYAKKKGIIMVLQKSVQKGPRSAVLYGNASIDITEDIIGKMNR